MLYGLAPSYWQRFLLLRASAQSSGELRISNAFFRAKTAALSTVFIRWMMSGNPNLNLTWCDRKIVGLVHAYCAALPQMKNPWKKAKVQNATLLIRPFAIRIILYAVVSLLVDWFIWS